VAAGAATDAPGALVGTGSRCEVVDLHLTSLP
jgi:hypothetical protein